LAELKSLLKPKESIALWAISVDSAEDSRALAKRLSASASEPYVIPLLADPQHRVIDAFGLQDPRYLKQTEAGIPYPATYVIDKAGRVAWMRVDRDYRQRSLAAEIRAALDALR